MQSAFFFFFLLGIRNEEDKQSAVPPENSRLSLLPRVPRYKHHRGKLQVRKFTHKI